MTTTKKHQTSDPKSALDTAVSRYMERVIKDGSLERMVKDEVERIMSPADIFFYQDRKKI